MSINQGNVPTTAAGFNNHSCDEFAGKDAAADGWLFVASPSDFVSFEGDFDQGKVFYNDPNGNTDSSSVSFPKQYDHLAVVTPAGYTLENAFAVLKSTAKNDKNKGFFTLSHTCPATQPPAQQSSPQVSFVNNCTTSQIDVTLGNSGTADAVFTLTGDLSKQDTVAPGHTTTEHVSPASGTTATVHVAADHLAGSPVTRTFDTATCGSSSNSGTPSPAASFSHSCGIGGISVQLTNAGTADADIVVSYDGSDHHYTVAPGGLTIVTVPVGTGTTKTVTVTSGGNPLGSDTFTANCVSTQPASGQQGGASGGGATGGGATGGGTTGPQHAINPAVSFTTACKTGITATFTNMKLDDTTMEPVTFTVSTPSGGTDSVTVAADQLVKRSYPVKEDTSGTLTVTAPGMAKQSKSYAKNCATVLGEKVVKGTQKPTVQGEKAQKLPFTGVPAGALSLEAMGLLAAGSLLAYTGRQRRYQARHARR